MLALGLVRPVQAARRTRARRSSRRAGSASFASPATPTRFLSEAEIDRALGESTVAVFPYRAELDQSGALLRALGAGVPAVVYDVGGLAEPVREFGAGRVVTARRRRRPGRQRSASSSTTRRLWRRHAPVRARARDELTWDDLRAGALALYGELL